METKHNDSLMPKLLNKFEWIHNKNELGPLLNELGVVQISILLILIVSTSLFKGLIAYLLLYYISAFVFSKFGYDLVSGTDVMTVIETHPQNSRNCTSYMKLGRITAKDLREKYILPKGIMKFKRLRQIWIKVLGFWFFKDISSEIAKNQVIKIDDDIRTQEDINNYMAKLVTLKLNLKSPLWEVHVKEDYDENTSIMFLVVHHILTDGMGAISLFSFMNDSHNPDNISQFKSIPFYFSYIAPILYLPIGIVKFTYAAMQTKKDPNMKAFSLKGGMQTYNKKYYESKHYSLSELKK